MEKIEGLDYNTAYTYASSMRSISSDIKATLDRLVQLINDDVNSGNVWKGELARRFLDKFNECSESFNTYLTQINEFCDNVDYTIEHISEFENSSIN